MGSEMCIRDRTNDVKGGAGVENDDVVEVGSDAVEGFDDLVDDFDEPPWSSAASLWHASHSKRRVGVQEAVRNIVFLCTVI